MSSFEEYLTLGQWLAESERLAIYNYLLQTRSDRYRNESQLLFSKKSLYSYAANGEIYYFVNSNIVQYNARKIGDQNWNNQIRAMKLSRIGFLTRRRLCKFFAQAELDVIRNFPNQGSNHQDEHSFTVNTYPFYTLDYFANGGGKLKGLFKKIMSKEDPLLEKLLAS